MIRFILSFFGAIFSAICIGALFAALTVGAIFWMYGRDLPDTDQLARYAPPTISRIYSSEGRIIDEFARERRLFAPADEIPALVKQAFISAEDKNFYTHGGFDSRGILAAAVQAVKSRGQTVRGASTITQQVMKNFLLGGERSAERKIKELILATRIEDTLSKDDILELYLNEIYLGQNTYGVAAAAQTYFNKTLGELTIAEAAYLGALPQRPAALHPVRDQEAAISRRNYVLREMYENGYITEDEYREARVQPLRSVQNGDFQSFRASLPARDYFTDEIRRQLSEDFGEGEFFTGGLSVRATVDPELQEKAAQALRAGLEGYDRSTGRWRGTGETIPEDQLGSEEKWRAALSDVDIARDIFLEHEWHPAVVLEVSNQQARLGIEGVTDGPEPIVPADDVSWTGQSLNQMLDVGDVVHVRRMTSDSDGSFIRWTLRQVPEVEGGFMAMDVHNGRVLAMQGGFSYQHSVFNRATQATRQPGSSFKPFVYAAALDSGFTPATIVVDAPIEVDVGGGEVWRPKNYSNRFYGPTPLRTGIERSRNVMTVRLAEEVGMRTVGDYAERFGVYDTMGHYLANSLGAEETTLFRMVAAYSMFANGGERVEPTLVDRVQDRYGKTVYKHDRRDCLDCDDPQIEAGKGPRIVSDLERVIDPITSYQITSMMQGVVERGTASGAVNLSVPVAGKTGTTNNERDAWFVGFTSNIAAGCYIGYDQPRPMGRSATGGGLCAPVFNEFMKEAVEKYGGGEFEVPDGGHFIKIDRRTGERLPDSASGEGVVAEYFRLGEEPIFGVAYDGGFAMGSDLPLFNRGENEDDSVQVRTATGEVKEIPKNRATVNSLSSGGLY
ncbi:penicillin-binding protein 1A [Tranquillimonas rosea]|uniref:penicillin-binding protein 1A n=1 Tax=Tranquillimonas rosea TaxID=641238 RepID=UPI003BA8706D